MGAIYIYIKYKQLKGYLRGGYDEVIKKRWSPFWDVETVTQSFYIIYFSLSCFFVLDGSTIIWLIIFSLICNIVLLIVYKERVSQYCLRGIEVKDKGELVLGVCLLIFISVGFICILVIGYFVIHIDSFTSSSFKMKREQVVILFFIVSGLTPWLGIMMYYSVKKLLGKC